MKEETRQILKASSRHRVGLMGDIILRNALFYPDREVFIYGEKRVTFQEYNRRVNSLVHALHDMGVQKGDVLGVLSWNCTEYMDVFGAAAKAGFIVSPYNVRLSDLEIEYLINDSEANTLFVGVEFKDMFEPFRLNIPKVKNFISLEGAIPGMESEENLVGKYPDDEPDAKVDDEDPFFICYTSGTTGLPRGALYTHQRVRDDIVCHGLEVPIGIEDKGISLMPFFHIGGIEINQYLLYHAATNVILKFFDPRVLLEAIYREKITNVCLVPTHLVMMLDLPEFKDYDISNVRRIYYAGSPMPSEILKRGMKVFGSVFFQGYGQTESGPVIAFLKERDHDVVHGTPEERQKLLSIGRPAIGVQVRIVNENGDDASPGEVGEIIAKSRHIMKEYWKKPKETAETIIDGWLHTGDMGRYDEDGYIYIVDRKRDMIVSGGENVYPREVEEILYRHPAVSECAVLGIPDAKWVEAVHAEVTLKREAFATPEELIAFCKENIARYKAPKSIKIIQELPKNATGKILKREIRKNYWPGKK